MKLVTFERKGKPSTGVLSGRRIVPLPYQSMIELLEAGEEALQTARKRLADKRRKRLSLAEVRLLAPVTFPRKLLCLAGNYSEHIRESGQEAPGKENMTPRVFMKPPTTTVIPPDAPIIIPRNAQQIDWEVELAFVIGKKARFVSAADAMDYIAGYTIVNDISERKLKVNPKRKKRPGDEWFDWLNGKWFDTFAPMGPCLVTADAIKNPHDLRIALRVNGKTMQDANTGQMIFSIPELIEFISSLVTLEVGDVVATGTPSGVGSSRGIFLKHGDVVEAEIEKIGVLRNPVEAES